MSRNCSGEPPISEGQLDGKMYGEREGDGERALYGEREGYGEEALYDKEGNLYDDKIILGDGLTLNNELTREYTLFELKTPATEFQLPTLVTLK